MNTPLFRWLAVIVWAAIIWMLSSTPSLASELSPSWDLVLRKIAHALEFGIFTLLLIRAWNTKSSRGVGIAIVVAALWAGIDEYHQTFVFGREGTIRDAVIDAFGITIAGLLVLRQYEAKKRSA